MLIGLIRFKMIRIVIIIIIKQINGWMMVKIMVKIKFVMIKIEREKIRIENKVIPLK